MQAECNRRPRDAGASRATVLVQIEGKTLLIEIQDDGRGGATPTRGLRGLADRVEASAGTLAIDSPTGGPTTIRAQLPMLSAPPGRLPLRNLTGRSRAAAFVEDEKRASERALPCDWALRHPYAAGIYAPLHSPGRERAADSATDARAGRRARAQGETPALRQGSCLGAPVRPSRRCWDGREPPLGEPPRVAIAAARAIARRGAPPGNRFRGSRTRSTGGLHGSRAPGPNARSSSPFKG